MTWVNNEIGFFCLDPDTYELLLYLPTSLFFLFKKKTTTNRRIPFDKEAIISLIDTKRWLRNAFLHYDQGRKPGDNPKHLQTVVCFASLRFTSFAIHELQRIANEVHASRGESVINGLFGENYSRNIIFR